MVAKIISQLSINIPYISLEMAQKLNKITAG
jgi:hypothetical protein